MYSLTTTDERCILLYYHQKINDICKFFRFQLSTVLSSHLIFSRVHMYKPIVDDSFDLKHIMLACVYLGSKIDEQHTSVDTFCAKIPGVQRKDIEELEFILLDWLDFDIYFDLPTCPLTAFLLEIFGKVEEDIYLAAAQSMVSMFMTDIPHLFNAAAIALASIKQAAIKFKVQSKFDDYMLKLDTHTALDCVQQVNNILNFVTLQPTTFDARYLKEIDAKLSDCRKVLLNQQ